MPYAQLSDGTMVDLVPFDQRNPAHQKPGGFQGVMHLPVKVGPHCSIQGTSVAVIEAQAQGTHQNGLPEGIQPWQELPK
jgi:hypothetical protein